MKIGVVGGGNGGLTVALTLLDQTYGDDVEIEIYYDPNIPIEKVGQGSLVNFVGILSDVLGMDWYSNPIDATFKTGILYEGWAHGNKMVSPFKSNSIGSKSVMSKQYATREPAPEPLPGPTGIEFFFAHLI